MKCPLLSEAVMSGYGERRFEVGDCLKADCAWWIVQKKECALITIALSLDLAQLSLESQANGLRR